MTWKSFTDSLTTGRLAVYAAVMFGSALLFFGLKVVGPKDTAAELATHEAKQVIEHAKIDSLVANQQRQLEGLVRLACLNETSDKLALAGLTNQCRTLGVPVSMRSGIGVGASK